MHFLQHMFQCWWRWRPTRARVFLLISVAAVLFNAICIWVSLVVIQKRGEREDAVNLISADLTRIQSVLISPALGRRSKFNSLMKGALHTMHTFPSQPDDYHTIKICLFTADIPFTPTHGGTATAYYLLAKHLAVVKGYTVTLVGLQAQPRKQPPGCTINVRDALTSAGIRYECLEPVDFTSSSGHELVSIGMWDTLALAVVRWMDRRHDHCDLIHGHEWGGVNALLALVLHLDPDRYSGVRLLIEPHGGHMWSRIGSERRPVDVSALHIDDMERISLELSDAVLSPSQYMLGYFATRGWRIPYRYVLPNIIEAVETNRQFTKKAVWWLCFVGRLDERKGIKVFHNLLQMLNESRNWNTAGSRFFEVMVFGTMSTIDGQPSDQWLNTQIINHTWSFPISVYIGLNRSMVWSIVRKAGALLVVPSLQENLSYVVAEGVTLGIPMVTFEVGGLREILVMAPDDMLTVCTQASVRCLHDHVRTILAVGHHHIPLLTHTMKNAGATWMRWHAAYRLVHQQLATEPVARMHALEQEKRGYHAHDEIQIVQLPPAATTTSVIQQVCVHEDLLPGPLASDDAHKDRVELALLLPTHFEIIPAVLGTINHTFQTLFSHHSIASELSNVGAVTFGVQLDELSDTYPFAPTWMLYGPDGRHCEEQFPVLVLRHVLCQSFAVDPHVFPTYKPWILADVLSQQDIRMLTYPEVLFRYRKGFKITQLPESLLCKHGTAPSGRYESGPMLDHFHREVSEDMRDIHSAHAPPERVHTEFTAALRTMRNRNPSQQWSFDDGALRQWKAGAMAEDGTIRWYTWYKYEQRFGCANTTQFAYPQITSYSVVHPCVSSENLCCGDLGKANSLVRYTFSADRISDSRPLIVRVIYESQTYCGDGVLIHARFTDNLQGISRVLFQDRVKLEQKTGSIVMRRTQTIELKQIQEGSFLDVIIDALDSLSCDEILLNVVMQG